MVKSLASGEEKNFSPILEMADKMFGLYDEMILVSDLMHHTSKLSLYKTVGNITTPTRLQKNLRGKKLKVIYVIRENLSNAKTPNYAHSGGGTWKAMVASLSSTKRFLRLGYEQRSRRSGACFNRFGNFPVGKINP